ncbi:hypothetical protein PAENIP36_67630 [Paenibacillus sp. P36]
MALRLIVSNDLPLSISQSFVHAVCLKSDTYYRAINFNMYIAINVVSCRNRLKYDKVYKMSTDRKMYF